MGVAMRWFHKHEWTERERIVGEGVKNTVKITNATPYDVERLVFGVTTVVFECKGCGELQTVEAVGRKEQK